MPGMLYYRVDLIILDNTFITLKKTYSIQGQPKLLAYLK